MKKILIITYCFAPYNFAGTFRLLKFVKYLPACGWQPLVLTCSNRLEAFYDHELLREIPRDIKVWKCPALGIYKSMQSSVNFLARLRRAEGLLPFRPQENLVKIQGEHLQRKRFFQNDMTERTLTPAHSVVDRIFNNLFIPDGMIDWLPLAAASARWIIRRHQVDVVLTSSPPHSTHLLGALLAQRKNLKWLVDLRDPWLDNSVRNKLQPVSKYRQALESRMEKWMVHQADGVIANTEINRRKLLHRYAALNPEKIAVIPNGFDAADLPPSSPGDEKPEKFIAAFAGYLYPGMADSFFRVLEKLLQNDPDLAQKLKIQIIGQRSTYYQDKMASANNGLAQITQWLGPMSHRQTLAHLQRSDLLLCFNFPTSEAAGVIPSKLYEYFMVAKPILAIGPEGEAAAMIRQAQAGQAFEPHQENEIAGALRNFLRRWQNGSLKSELNQEYIQRFDRRLLTQKLADLCEALC